jgi:DNA-binding beta-propeller fold protein YncE
MPYAHALLRAGFPYLTTLGMRRVTTFPSDLGLGNGGRIYVVCRTEVATHIRRINWDDEDLGAIDGPFVWPVGVVCDADENLYVSDEGDDTIKVFTQTGDAVAKWGKQGAGPGELNRPSGLAFDADGHLWVADTQNHRVQKFTRDGEALACWGSFGAAPGELNMPWGLALDDEGYVYVADWRNDRVQKFDQEGRLVMALGRSGGEEGEFNRPSGVAVDEHGDIYVADRGNNRVQLFDHRGRYVEKFIGDATLSKMGRKYVLANHKTLRLREMTTLEPQKRFRAPTAVRVDAQGRLYVADQGSHRIQVYQKDAIALSEDEIMPELSAPTLMTT